MNNNVPLKTLRNSQTIDKIVEDSDMFINPKQIKSKQITPTINTTFNRPQTEQEWSDFHKNNEINMVKAYASPEGYYKDNNKLYIAGTRDIQDVLDWVKIPLGTFKNSKIYKNIEPVFKEDSKIDTVIGHSAGGSASLELEKNYPDRNITSITYNAPVFERLNPEKIFNEDKKPMRFAVSGDPVSMLDMNAQTTFKAPNFSLDKVQNAVNTFTNPSFENLINVAKNPIQSIPDPTFGLHSMSGTYSNPSKAIDFVKSGLEGVAVGNSLGII